VEELQAMTPTAAHCVSSSRSPKPGQRAELILRDAGLKVTEPRKKVLRVLIEKHGPVSVDEIRRGIRKGECDLVTIYRSISALEKSGVVTRFDFGDGVARFEFGASAEHHHHHVICRRCRAVEPLELCLNDEWKNLLNQKGYSELSHSLEFFGVCAGCRSTSP
jgi:Fur family transcriptional regulator, ferric uptake regulator